MKKYSRLILVAILGFAFVTRVYRLDLPTRYIFDEVYHVITAKLIAHNDPRAFEWWHGPIEPDTAIDWLHPPHAKYTQALTIRIFGENSFGWRASSAIFGVGVILLVFILAEKLFTDWRLSLLAAWLASLDGLLLVQSRIAMNDIHVTFFILLTLIFYVKFFNSQRTRFLWLAGVASGLAMGSKWSGLFVVLILWLIEGIRSSWQLITGRSNWSVWWSKLSLLFLAWGLLPIGLYIGSYSMMFLQGKDWTHFKQLHQQIWGYQTHLQATHTYQSRPWEWFLNLKPVWFHVEYVDSQHIANIYSTGNSMLLWLGGGAALFSVGYLLFQALKAGLAWFQTHRWPRPSRSQILSRLAVIVTSYWLVWAPWVISPRIMFFYHYTPAVPLLAIILAWWLIKLWDQPVKKLTFNQTRLSWTKILVVMTVALIATNFVIWYPHWTALPVSTDWANQVYFALKSWK